MRKFQLAAQVVGVLTIAFLALLGGLSLLAAGGLIDSAAAQGGTASSAAAGAAIPESLNYQGFVRDPQGVPVTGLYTVTASIYDAASGGSQLFSTVVKDVQFLDGLFNVVLEGAGAAFDGADRYIGIRLDDGDELIPRQRLHAVPWAMSATQAMTATTLVSNAEVNGLTVENGLAADSLSAGSLQLSGELTFTDRAPFLFFSQTLSIDALAWYQRDGINADTGVLASEYTCAIGGFSAGWADLYENDHGWVLAAYMYVNPATNTWTIAAWLRVHGQGTDWSMRVMCVDNRLAEVGPGYSTFDPGWR